MPLMALTHTVTFDPNLVEFTEASDKSTTIRYSEIFNNEIPGHPSLPVQYLKFILPQDSNVEDIIINSVSYTYASEIMVTPGLQINSDGSESISKPDDDIYLQDKIYPEHQAILKEHTNYDGNVRVVTIAFYPLQYEPVQKKLIFNEKIIIELNYSNKLPAHVNPKYSYSHHLKENIEYLEKIITNKNDISSFYPSRTALDIVAYEHPDFIIIGHAALESSFDRYIDWKRKKGYRVAYKTIKSIESAFTGDDVCTFPINDTPGKIRQYLRERKNNTPLEYVLIVGGLEDGSVRQPLTNNNQTNPTVRYSVAEFDKFAWRHLPAQDVDQRRYLQTASDHYFANLSDDWNSVIEPDSVSAVPKTEGDFYGTPYDTITTGFDLKVSRLIANSSQEVINFTDKVIKYETYNHMNAFNTFGFVDNNQSNTPNPPTNWDLSYIPLPTSNGQVENFYLNSFNSNLTMLNAASTNELKSIYRTNPVIKSFSGDLYPHSWGDNNYGFDSIPETAHGVLIHTMVNKSGSFFQTGNDGYSGWPHDLLTDKASIVEAWTCSFSGQGGPVAIAASGRLKLYTHVSPTMRQNLVNNYSQSSNLYNVFNSMKSDIYTNDRAIFQNVRTLNYYGDPVLRTWTNTPQLYSIQLNLNNNSIKVVDRHNNPVGDVKTVFFNSQSSQIIRQTNSSGYAYANQSFVSVTISGDNIIPVTVQIVENNADLYGDLETNTIYYIPSGNTANITANLNLKGKGYHGSQIYVERGATLNISDNLTISGELKSAFNRKGNLIEILGYINIGNYVVFSGEMDHFVLNNSEENTFNNVYFDGVTLENNTDLTLSNSNFIGSSLIHNNGNLTLDNVSGTDSNDVGLYVKNADYLTIHNSSFTGNYLGALIGSVNKSLDIFNSNFSYNANVGLELSNTLYVYSNIENSTFSHNGDAGLLLYNSEINLLNSTINNNDTGVKVFKSVIMTDSSEFLANNLISNNTNEEILFCKASALQLKYNRIVDNHYQAGTRDQYLIVNVDNTNDYLCLSNIFWGRDAFHQLIQPPANRFIPQAMGHENNILPMYNYMDSINPPTDPEIKSLYNNAVNLYIEDEVSQSQAMMFYIIENYPDSDYAVLATKNLLKLYDLSDVEISGLQSQYQNNEIFTANLKLQKNAQNMYTEAYLMLSDYDSAIENYLSLIENPETVTDSVFANIDLAYALLLQEESGQKSRFLSRFRHLKPKNIKDFHQTRNKHLANLLNNKDTSDTGNSITPVSFNLIQNYPNPFNPETTIAFTIPSDEQISLEVYNIKGQKVKTLVNEKLVAGRHSYVWNGTDQNNNSVSSGIYFYRLKSGTFTSTKKMILMK